MKTLIGIPAMDFVSTSFMTCLTGLQPVGDTSLHVVQSQCFLDNNESFAKLFNDPDFYQKVQDAMAAELYKALRKD